MYSYWVGVQFVIVKADDAEKVGMYPSLALPMKLLFSTLPGGLIQSRLGEMLLTLPTARTAWWLLI
jgi:hypothetical protein